MQFKKDGKINWFLFLRFFGISLFVIVLFKIDLTQVWTSITKIEGKYFFIALLFQFILLISKGIRWHLLKQSHEQAGLEWGPLGASAFCIMKLYAEFYGEWQQSRNSYRWQSLTKAGTQCGINIPNSHRAKDDTLLARAVLQHMTNARA